MGVIYICVCVCVRAHWTHMHNGANFCTCASVEAFPNVIGAGGLWSFHALDGTCITFIDAPSSREKDPGDDVKGEARVGLTRLRWTLEQTYVVTLLWTSRWRVRR